MKILRNPFRGEGLAEALSPDVPGPSTDVAAVLGLLETCPAAAETPLVTPDSLAEAARVGRVFVKDERGRI